jgi:putative restriction endonuclease
MAKVVLTTKVDPAYDDLPEERYHFPRTYLRQVEQAVGDWAVYYEPRRSTSNLASSGGRQSYFATAKILRIEKDLAQENHYYAFVSDYLEFDHPVSFKEGVHYFESALQKDDGGTNKGAFGRSVRVIPDSEYEVILQAGFTETLELTKPEADTRQEQLNVVEEPIAYFERHIVERVVARPFRDAAFAMLIKEAYQNTCAMTGLRIVNGGGRAEVQAAHIQPVSESGPDSLRNGIALTGTVHWMFDRGLISIDDDYSILIAKDRLPDAATRLLNESHRLLLPSREDLRPHRHYLAFHRNHKFKG